MQSFTSSKIIVTFLLILFFTVFSSAEEAKKKFKLGFTERIRHETWDNTVTLKKDVSTSTGYTRFRTTLSGQWTPSANFELTARVTNEFRNWLAPKGRDLLLSEVFIDNLFLKWKNPASLPLTLIVGRQNIMLGEGFIFMDGYPLDGSRSIYFNAFRADIRLAEKHTLSVILAHQPRTDTLAPKINDQHLVLLEQPETGAALYYSGEFCKVKLEGYALRKYFGYAVKAASRVDYTTLGARVGLPLLCSLTGTAELALQTGQQQGLSRNGLGGYIHLDYRFCESVPLLRTLTLGGIYLSGDDPATPGKNEGWDPVFSRWPKWSESLTYTISQEKGAAYWSNLNSVYLSALLNLNKETDVILTWHRLGAVHQGAPIFPGGLGKKRGDLFIGRLNFRVNVFTTGHFIWEHFRPGDFYFKGAVYANWVRFELLFQL